MCGICGGFAYAGTRPLPPEALRAMNDALVHRGPDDEGYFVEGPVALAVRRLSIIDLVTGHQPLSNEDGTIWVGFNGEIYNFQELRDELGAKGHRFRTRGDTEIIVHAYEEYGDDCCSRFNGMFAFALWDARRRRLLLARDHFGVKPLYYVDRNGRLDFASEIKALVHGGGVARRVDLEALGDYLTFRQVPSPRTLFQGVSKLRPGHVLVCDASGVSVRRYSATTPQVDCRRNRYEYVEGLRERLKAAVRRQMVSDVPIGVLLSGGVDSSAVVALMREVSDGPIRSFVAGFRGQGADAINELAQARRVADLFGTEHHEAVVDVNEYLEMLPRSLHMLDEPIATTSALALYFVCRLARQHVKVVLTGQGADEAFAGYRRYLSERYGHLYRLVPPLARRRVITPLVERLPRNEALKRAVRTAGVGDHTDRFWRTYMVFTEEAKRALLRSAAGVAPSVGVVEYWRSGVEHLDPLAQMQYVDARLSLADDLLLLGDKMSMAASVEARVPYLDLDLMRFVESIPSSLKISGLRQKAIHKEAVSAWLPRDVVQRRKVGFATPMDRWFQEELTGRVRADLLGPDAASPLYFDRAQVARLIDDHVTRRQDNQRQLFALWSFELWHRAWMG